jgi:hypothetical protein
MRVEVQDFGAGRLWRALLAAGEASAGKRRG